MKKLFIAAILLMGCTTIAVFGANSAFGIMQEEGYAVPASAGVLQALTNGAGAPIALTKVQYEDVVYSTLTGYYVGEDREKIDLAYPLYTNGGMGVRFLDDEAHWLLTPDVELYQTFRGLYISEGISYNEDMTQADECEFILAALSNGLYMNVQQACFTGPLGSTVIPANSILSMEEDSIRWYGQKNGSLAYHSEEAVFDAVLSIGGHSYPYADLLDALGLVRQAVDSGNGTKPDPEKLQEAEELLNPGEAGGHRRPGQNQDVAQTPGHTAEQDNQAETGGNGQGGQADDGTGPDENSGAGGASEEHRTPDVTSGEQNAPAADHGQDGAGGAPDASAEEGKPAGGDLHDASGGGSSGGSGNSGGGGSTGSSGSASGGNNSGDSSIEGGSEDETGGGDDDEGGDEPSGTPGEPVPAPYQEPVVKLSGIEPWSYAIGMHLSVDDPSGAIMRGVSISVFRSIKGSGGTATDGEGHTIYPSASYDGKSAMLRKNKTGTQSFALSTLQPGQTVYLQYSYRYNAEVSEVVDGTDVKKIVRKYYYSDLIELKLPTVTEGGVKTVGANWSTAFAAQADALKLNGLSMFNTSGYDAGAAYSFDNFKLNSLPYVSRLELKLTPAGGGEPVTVSVGSSVLARAQSEGTSFTSASPKLASNTAYTYTVAAKDRWGNELPLNANGTDSYSGTVYTRKAAPSVTITEVENVTDFLRLSIKVSDPDKALADGQPLYLTVSDKTGAKAYLYGAWDTSEISAGGETVDTLELKNPGHDREYTLELNSLAFSTLYAVEVRGSCAPQPDGAPAAEAALPIEKDALFGKLSVYTAALSSGLISFTTGVSDLLDTSATLNVTMTSATTLDMLPLVDEFRVILKDGSGASVSTTTLSQKALTGTEYTYDTENALVELQPGSAVEPRVVLYGTRDKFQNTPWNSFCVREVATQDHETGEGKTEYTVPMQLRVMLPEGSLEHFTKYTFSVQAVVKKSGQEYLIPVSMTTNSFTTKKTLPKVQYSDLFLAADIAEFLKLKIYDPDGTILNDGAVMVYLYYGSTLLSAQQITADRTGGAEGVDLRFKGLIEGGAYTLKFVASAYNDAEGYGSYDSNHVLETFNITGGDALKGTLELASLDGGDAQIRTRVDDTKGYLGREGEKAQVTLTVKRSLSMEQPDYEPYKEFILPLGEDPGDPAGKRLTLDKTVELAGLPMNDAWEATLTAVYQGSTVLLDQITFRTDGKYVTVSTHAELIAAQDDKKANILVVSDFTQDQNKVVSGFCGSIDFQGHVVTRGEGITTSFLTFGDGGRVSNLVYDYPDEAYYVNTKPIFGTCYNAENLIVRTHGQIEINAASTGLIAETVAPAGRLSNFIVRLGGDLIANVDSATYITLFVTPNGIMENGYVYGVNGAGLVFRNCPSGAGFAGLLRYGKLHNVYMVLDSWYQTEHGSVLTDRYTYNNKSEFENIYVVGDYYSIREGENKSWLLQQQATRLAHVEAGSYKRGYKNVWALTALNYPKEANEAVHLGSTERLYDVEWQKSLLGGAFDVEGCVPMGFYPRLELPSEMQKYQEYLPLPLPGQEAAPQIVRDSWGVGEVYGQHDLDSGYIRLRMQNDNNYKIEKVAISGLLTSVVDQTMAEDGFYDVTLNVEVDPQNPEYLSRYTVTELTYSEGSVTRTVHSGYQTVAIEFWKSVTSPSDWADINNNMKWNYKLTADLDFANTALTYNDIIINGTRANFTNTTSFTGRLDGQEHVLSNITLKNITNPYLISGVSRGEVRNLLVENLNITASSAAKRAVAGLIGAVNISLVDNVRMKNCSITGGGSMGLLIGSVSASYVTNCSAADCALQDVETGQELFAGGLVGTIHNGAIDGCYTRNVSMDISRSNVVFSVGGLAARISGGATIDNCYAHGSLRTNASKAGGILGSVGTGDSAYVRKSWSYVDLYQSSGDKAGGLAAEPLSVSYVLRCAALGNVAGAGPNTHRLFGYISSHPVSPDCYAFAGQIVTNVAADDKDDAKALLTGEELGSKETWQDMVRLGTAWDYSPVTEGCAPVLAADCEREGWRQEPVPLPGQANDPSLQVVEARYSHDGAQGTYFVQAMLTHPGFTHEQLQGLKLELEGMDISDAAQAGDAEVEISSGGENITYITITTHGFEKAVDAYPLTVSYTEPGDGGRERRLSTLVSYLEGDGTAHRVYWTICNLTEWNAVMKDHGTTNENIRIDGTVDFGGDGTKYNNLSVNRLEGEAGATLKNLKYQGGGQGSPWFEKVGASLEGLTFENMTFDFTQRGDSPRTMTGVFLSVSSASNLTLKDISMTCNRFTRDYFGFISKPTGAVTDVDMETIRVQDAEPSAGSTEDRCAALVAGTASEIRGVTARDITIDCPKHYYVGAVLGYHDVYGVPFNDVHVSNFTIKGGAYVGPLAGYASATSAQNFTAEGTEDTHSTVTGVSNVGGLFGRNHGGIQKNIEVEWVDVTATGGTAGGLTGSTTHHQLDGAAVRNCVIQGTTYVGGINGDKTGGLNDYYNVQVENCTIESTAASGTVGSSGVGGVSGRITTSDSVTIYGAAVRNCQISGPCCVGGLIGFTTRTSTGPKMDRIYVAEDVSVTATGEIAGGLVGYANYLDLSDSACGATVKAKETAGGIVGQVALMGGKLQTKLQRVYYRGSVTAENDYAGGLIGKLDSTSEKFTDEQAVNCLVAADVRGKGENVSPWINDTSPTGSAGTGTIYIWEDSLLNGQLVKAIAETAKQLGKTVYVTPIRDDDKQLLVPSASFNTRELYTKLGFTGTYWELGHIGDTGNLYMPYTKNKAGKAVLEAVNQKDGKAAGIPLPDAKDVGVKTVVYASGANTVNIEVGADENGPKKTSVTVNGNTYQVDRNGVATLYYDFKTALNVDGVEVEADELSRKVMTYGEYWYYIGSDGSIRYGKATGSTTADMKELGTVSGISDAVHLWQGRAMDGDGKVWTLNGGAASEESGQEVTADKLCTRLEKAEPFCNDGGVQVYYYFSLYADQKLPYRVFRMNNTEKTAFTVSPSQNTVYDGVILQEKTLFASPVRYFGLLGEDGTLTAYLTNLKLGPVVNSSIRHISNHIGYQGTVLLAYYGNGTVIGVDYSTGDRVCTTQTAAASFMSYALQSIKGLFHAGVGSPLEADGSYLESEALWDQLAEDGCLSTVPGVAEESGDGEGGDAPSEESGGAAESADGPDTAESGGDSADEPGMAEIGKDGGTDEAAAEERGADNPPTGADGPGNGEENDGAPTGEMGDSPEADGGQEASQTGSGPAGSPASGPAGTGAQRETEARTEAGGEASPASGGGTGPTGPQSPAETGRGPTAEKAMLELFGEAMIAYSEETGRYELLETASVQAGTPVEMTQALASRTDPGGAAADGEQPAQDDETPEGGSSGFTVAWGINRSLDTAEKRGFALLAAASVAAAIGLIALFSFIRKQKK